MKIIEEVCLIRLVLIVLLVLYHSFAPFCGAWNTVDFMNEYPHEIYWWIGKTAYSFMLECFTLISGWIFGSQFKAKGSNVLNVKKLLHSKVKRLIFPSIVFSLIYILIFDRYLLYNPLSFIYSIFEGYGHMWYLPMLFWCFFGIVLVEKCNLKMYKVIICLILLSIISFYKLPFRLNYSMYYMIYFYVGYLIGKGNINLRKWMNIKFIGIFYLLYLFLFILSQAYINPIIQLYKTYSILSNIIGSLIIRMLHFSYSMSGIIAIVLGSMYLLDKKYIHLNRFWIQIGTYTFGVYIFQQFILMWLYYHTDIFNSIPDYLIPWGAFIVTLILSLFLTIFIRNNKYGKLLI